MYVSQEKMKLSRNYSWWYYSHKTLRKKAGLWAIVS